MGFVKKVKNVWFNNIGDAERYCSTVRLELAQQYPSFHPPQSWSW